MTGSGTQVVRFLVQHLCHHANVELLPKVEVLNTHINSDNHNSKWKLTIFELVLNPNHCSQCNNPNHWLTTSNSLRVNGCPVHF